MNEVTASAPGKLMLIGEHAVIYGYPCIVTSVNKKIKVTVKKTIKNSQFSNPSIFITASVYQFFKRFHIKSGLQVETSADFPSTLGLGSSSAVTVAAVKALSLLFDINLARNEIFKLSHSIVESVQGKASGFDIAAATYGGTLYYQLGKPPIRLPERKIPLLVVYSGQKASTSSMIQKVSLFKKNNPLYVNDLFKQTTSLVEKGRSAYLKSDWKTLGDIFNQSHEILIKLGVSTEKLNYLAQIANKNGAYGAKLSGAGGGDCVIVLYPQKNKQAIIEAMEKNGGQIIKI